MAYYIEELIANWDSFPGLFEYFDWLLGDVTISYLYILYFQGKYTAYLSHIHLTSGTA